MQYLSLLNWMCSYVSSNLLLYIHNISNYKNRQGLSCFSSIHWFRRKKPYYPDRLQDKFKVEILWIFWCGKQKRDLIYGKYSWLFYWRWRNSNSWIVPAMYRGRRKAGFKLVKNCICHFIISLKNTSQRS